MTNAAVQKEAIPLAGGLATVNVQTLAKLSMLSLTKPDIDIAGNGGLPLDSGALRVSEPDSQTDPAISDQLRLVLSELQTLHNSYGVTQSRLGHLTYSSRFDYRETREMANPLMRHSYNDSLELADWMILFNSGESPESPNSLSSSKSCVAGSREIKGDYCSCSLKPENYSGSAKHYRYSGSTEHKQCLGSAIIQIGCNYVNQMVTEKSSTANAALLHSASIDHSSGVAVLDLRWAISMIARIFSPALVPISSICASDASAPLRFDISLFSSLSFSWRRSISPCIAATMKPALLSPFNFTPSMPSSTSCGMRAVTDWDFALVEPVAINQPSVNWCLTVYTKLNYTKELMCKPLGFIFNYTLSTGKAQAPLKIVRPRSARTHAGPLTTSDRISIEVAVMNITTHPQGRDSLTLNKFTWRFLALSANTRNVISITAATEREARDQSPTGCVMVFAGRLPVQEANHA